MLQSVKRGKNPGIPVIYENLCNVCSGDLTYEEIESRKCRAKNIHLDSYFMDKREVEFEELFRKTAGKPKYIQKFWMRRLIAGESFTLVAPTGIGKTTFGLISSIFFHCEGKKSYIILPTTLLVIQCIENIKEFAKKAGKNINLGYFHGNLKRSEKKENLEKIKNGDFDILVTTAHFISKRFDILEDKIFDFIFVDDVDSILKSSKNVERVVHLLGFRGKGNSEKHGLLVVSTATAKKGKSAELFKKLLNFDVGSSFSTIRNIEDVFIQKMDVEEIKKIMRKMGKGGIIYAGSVEEAEKYHTLLKDEFRVGLVVSKKNKDYELFERGELDYLIGTSYYYGALIRGLDLPEKIRYAIFISVPSLKLRFDSLTSKMVKILAFGFRRNKEIQKLLPFISNIEKNPEKFDELKKTLLKVLKEDHPEDFVIRGNEIIFPDIRTYIQGSGRTSRLTGKGLTKGASFVLEDDQPLLKAFIKKASYYDIKFKTANEIDFDRLIDEIDVSRLGKSDAELIKPALFIVESPTKAKQISRFFGKPSLKFMDGWVVYEVLAENYILLITASLGHLTDLTAERGFHGVIVNEKFIPVYSTIKRCRSCGYQFKFSSKKCPKCQSDEIDDSKTRINLLRRLAREAGFVIIGTDPDAEGEKIAWDLKNLLAGMAEIKRAEFHEITPDTVKKAISQLRDIDENLVKAQIVRRIEDRWIGFVLTQKLWQTFRNKNISAGRVQTPVLKWIIEHEKKFRKRKRVSFIPELNLVLDEYLKEENLEIEITLKESKKERREPLPPYTTDEMLRDANRILGLNANKIMKTAQDLFELGLITYHRTDSTHVSETGRKIASEYLGADFKGREWAKKGTHECIRPTRPWDRFMVEKMIYEGILRIDTLTGEHLNLYDLIFRRFMSSQCKGFEVESKIYEIKYNNKSVTVERITEISGKAVELYRILRKEKPLPEGRYKVKLEDIKIPESYPLTQAEAIKLMKESSIGRPSTYSIILEKLFMRKYIIERKKLLFSTKLGKEVFSFLSKNYSNFISEKRTKDF